MMLWLQSFVGLTATRPLFVQADKKIYNFLIHRINASTRLSFYRCDVYFLLTTQLCNRHRKKFCMNFSQQSAILGVFLVLNEPKAGENTFQFPASLYIYTAAENCVKR